LENYLAQTREQPYDPAQLQLLAKAVKDLPPHENILIDLFFREGLSAKEVAAILRMSIGAVYIQKSRILAKLKEMLSRANSL
jgi:RNA polymerase sigma factor (sigma-70 family)